MNDGVKEICLAIVALVDHELKDARTQLADGYTNEEQYLGIVENFCGVLIEVAKAV